MKRFFETQFLEEARLFIDELPPKVIRKILFLIDVAEQTNDAKKFKKLRSDNWEFRVRYVGLTIRFLAFWDKTESERTLVIITHGFFKKVNKVPANELDRAIRLRQQYFERWKTKK